MILLDVIVGEEGTLLNQQSKKQKTTKTVISFGMQSEHTWKTSRARHKVAEYQNMTRKLLLTVTSKTNHL